MQFLLEEDIGVCCIAVLDLFFFADRVFWEFLSQIAVLNCGIAIVSEPAGMKFITTLSSLILDVQTPLTSPGDRDNFSAASCPLGNLVPLTSGGERETLVKSKKGHI